MADRDERNHGDYTVRRKTGWLPWVIGAILLVLLVLGLRSCNDGEEEGQLNESTAVLNEDANNTGAVGAGATSAPVGPGAVAVGGDVFTAEGLRGYLQGTDAAGANGRAFGLDRVTFDTGSAELDAADRAVIAEAGGVLKQFPNASAVISGFADPAGDAAANQKLSADRADAVMQALSASGVSAAKLTTQAAGETGNAAVQENRRAELMVRR